MIKNIFDILDYEILKYLDIKSIIYLKKSNIHVFNKKKINNIIYRKSCSIFYRLFKKYMGYINILSNNAIELNLFVNDNILIKKLRAMYFYRFYPRHLVPIYINIAYNYIDNIDNNMDNIISKYSSYQLYKLIKQLNLVDIIEIGW